MMTKRWKAVFGARAAGPLLVCSVFAAGCEDSGGGESPVKSEPILDHVVLAARSRGEAEQALAEAGLAFVPGRTITGMGLTNIFVPLGGVMLEVHYPNGEPVTAEGPPYAEIQRKALAEHPGVALLPVVWLVRWDDVQRLRDISARNGLPARDVPPAGAVPAYTLGSFGVSLERPWLPPLIHWPMPPAERIAARSAPHRREPSGELTLDLSGPSSEVDAWCGGAPKGVRTVPGTRGPLRVHVGMKDGATVTFGILEP